MEANATVQVSEALQSIEGSLDSTSRRVPYWLITKRIGSRVNALTTVLADGRITLPVFSFEAEAELFLHLIVQESCQIRPAWPGELVSLLYSSCRKVELVALDPVSDAEADVLNECVRFERRRFVDVLLRREASVKLLPRVP